MKKTWQQELKTKLTPQQFEVCCNKGTERAFTGQYYDCKDKGIYQCVCCGSALFSSEAKFDSGSGWPSFFEPVAKDNLKTNADTGHGIRRTEVLCAVCEAHLGHVFDDGPQPTGQRFCINSASLKLKRDDSY